jgi:hypothetical protein
MYPQNQSNALTGTAGVATYSQPVAPPNGGGIASVLSELQCVAANTRKLAYSVRAALGIAQPESSEVKPTQASSLADAMNDIRVTLLRANEDFEMIIIHINS